MGYYTHVPRTGFLRQWPLTVLPALFPFLIVCPLRQCLPCAQPFDLFRRIRAAFLLPKCLAIFLNAWDDLTIIAFFLILTQKINASSADQTRGPEPWHPSIVSSVLPSCASQHNHACCPRPYAQPACKHAMVVCGVCDVNT